MSKFMLRRHDNKRKVKVKQHEIYSVHLDKWPEWSVKFQEQPGSSTDWGGVHTHIWIDNETEHTIIPIFLDFACSVMRVWPKKLLSLALVFAVAVEDESAVKYVFVDETYTMEMCVRRKISQTLIDEICGWLSFLLGEFHLYLGFRCVFCNGRHSDL
ncbi:MAG: hypothetical protein ACTSYX_12680 [Candidatus Thorarchaeota archaeon]